MIDGWKERAEARREEREADRQHLIDNPSEWEPSYGFCASNETDTVALAMTLEALRRRICAYGGGNRCDCKYGLRVERGAVLREFGVTKGDDKFDFAYRGVTAYNSEQTGCPELREMIHRLLHRDTPLF
jgi:hypothetical protein